MRSGFTYKPRRLLPNFAITPGILFHYNGQQSTKSILAYINWLSLMINDIGTLKTMSHICLNPFILNTVIPLWLYLFTNPLDGIITVVVLVVGLPTWTKPLLLRPLDMIYPC